MELPQRAPRYAEHRPDPRLRDEVACYWTLVGSLPHGFHGSDVVVPDAAMDLLFDLLEGDGRLVGTMTRPLRVPRAADVAYLGVRFHPGAGSGWAGVAAVEVTDRSVPLTLLDGAYAEWGPRLAQCATVDHALLLIDRLLVARRAARAPRTDGEMLLVAHAILRSGGRASVVDLARSVGVGRRQLERRFRASVGLSPRQMGRVVRFQRAIDLLIDAPATPLASVAVRCGYFDQAHFGTEFRRLAGEPPGAYRRRRLAEAIRVVGDADVAFLQDTAPARG
jgi:AraC-like DNA-binding protein